MRLLATMKRPQRAEAKSISFLDIGEQLCNVECRENTTNLK